MVQYTGINHLALVTGDMDATIAFWRDLLGLPLVGGLGHPGYRHYFFALSEHDMIAFFEWPKARKLPPKDHGVPVEGPVGFDHVSMAVASDDDLWELSDKLTAAGIWVSEVIDHGFIHSIYTFDPNEIPIEFSAPVAEVDLRRKPRMTDSAPSPLAREGAAPVPGRWPEVTRPTPAEERWVFPGEGTIFREADG
jgi:catechol 2,3-dioxygenase-like lactoylglutathione lyase family enzyme